MPYYTCKKTLPDGTTSPIYTMEESLAKDRFEELKVDETASPLRTYYTRAADNPYLFDVFEKQHNGLELVATYKLQRTH